jgi:hypothetical protein
LSRLKPDPLNPQRLAELCLSHLAEDPEVLGEFLVQSGYSPDRLRKALGTETLDRGLIDYFAQNESLLLALCANNAIAPESFMQVWGRLNPAG